MQSPSASDDMPPMHMTLVYFQRKATLVLAFLAVVAIVNAVRAVSDVQSGLGPVRVAVDVVMGTWAGISFASALGLREGVVSLIGDLVAFMRVER